jgi:hypothetical protein
VASQTTIKAKQSGVVVSTTEAKKIKLNQDGNIDKLTLILCVRGDLQKKNDPIMGNPHSPAVSMRMSKLLMADTSQHKAGLFQLAVSGAFLKKGTGSRVFITLPKVYGEVFPGFKEY